MSCTSTFWATFCCSSRVLDAETCVVGSTVELWLLLTLQRLTTCASGDRCGQKVVLMAWAAGRMLSPLWLRGAAH
eukprot:5617439-Prymnesium_polylepis.1